MISSYFNQFFVSLCSSQFMAANLTIVLLLSLSLYWIFKPSVSLIPRNVFELMFKTVKTVFRDEVKQTIKTEQISSGYFTLVFSLFSFILLVNILGLIPYTFSPTVHISVTIGLSLTIIIGATIHAILNFKDEYFAVFTPAGAPIGLAPFLVIIETVSHLAKIISLGVRLAANITAGHLLLAIFSTFGLNILLSSWFVFTVLPGSILMFVIVLEFAVAFIQAYVFVLLTVIYISEGYHSH